MALTARPSQNIPNDVSSIPIAFHSRHRLQTGYVRNDDDDDDDGTSPSPTDMHNHHKITLMT